MSVQDEKPPQDPGSQDLQESPPSRWQQLTTFGLIVLSLLLAVPLSALLWTSLADVIGSVSALTTLIAVLLISAFFPLTALAYYRFRKPLHLRQLTLDFYLLGVLPDDLANLPDDPLEQSDAGEIRKKNALETKQRVEARYNSLYNPANFALMSMIAGLLTFIGLLIIFGKVSQTFVDLVGVNTLPALQYGFIGSYLFAVQLVYRRYTTFDLQPYVYLYAGLTLIAGFAFNFVLFEVINQVANNPENPVTGSSAISVGVLAFSFGYFPNLAIRVIDRTINIALNAAGFSRANRLPLRLIDGISLLDEVRLRDEGIDNIQNLASVKIPDLLLRTRFSVQQVVEWVDQAVLYLYLGDQEDALAISKTMDVMTRLGIRGVTDLHDQWIPEYEVDPPRIVSIDPINGRQENRVELRDNSPDRCDPDDPTIWSRLRKQLLDSNDELREPPITPERLDAIYRATRYGPNMAYIRNYWRNVGIFVDLYLNQAAPLLLRNLERKTEFSISPAATSALIKSIGQGSWYEKEEELLKALDNRELTELERQLQETDENLTPDEYLGRARVAQWRNDDQRAIAFYKKAIEADPSLTAAYNDLAWIYITSNDSKKHEYEAAYDAASIAVSQMQGQTLPKQAAYLDTLAAANLAIAENIASLSPEEKRTRLQEARSLLEPLREAEILDEIPAYGQEAIGKNWKRLLRLEKELGIEVPMTSTNGESPRDPSPDPTTPALEP
jgi:tetratricopeptide (TPR) repeat protein